MAARKIVHAITTGTSFALTAFIMTVPSPGHAENALGYDGASEQISEVDAYLVEYGQHGVHKGVTPDDSLVGAALGARRADIVLAYGLKHRRTRQALQARGREDGRAADRHYVAGPAVNAARRKPAEVEAEHQHGDHVHPEAREGRERYADHTDDVVADGVLLHGGEHAEGDAYDGIRHGLEHGKLERIWEIDYDLVHDQRAVLVGGPEIKGHDVDKVFPQPLKERERISKLRVQKVNLLLGRHGPEHAPAGVAGYRVYDAEHDDGHAQDYRYHKQQAFDNVSCHIYVSLEAAAQTVILFVPLRLTYAVTSHG